MRENNYWEREVVITEITKGKELMLQLQKYFDPMKQDVCQYLAGEILSSYDKALSLLNGTALSEMMMSKGKQTISPAPSSSAAPLLESSHLLADNCTKSCDPPSNSRKRKMSRRRTLEMQPRRVEYIKARSGEVVPPEDGYSWRKYGQKNILEAKYPREYYRCAHRHVSSCMALKWVQQCETDPLAFEVTYGGSHSCGQETKHQYGEKVVRKETQCDEVGRTAGETCQFSTPEMVSTPNDSFNNYSNSNSGFFPTPTSSPCPDMNTPLYDDNGTGLTDDESYNAMLRESSADEEWRNVLNSVLSFCAATETVQQSETEPLAFEVTYGGSRSCGQEKEHQQGENVLTKETRHDEVGRAAGETSQFSTPETVSTPNNSLNNSSTGIVFSKSDFDDFSTPTSLPNYIHKGQDSVIH